jgi:hypothetical protein
MQPREANPSRDVLTWLAALYQFQLNTMAMHEYAMDNVAVLAVLNRTKGSTSDGYTFTPPPSTSTIDKATRLLYHKAGKL